MDNPFLPISERLTRIELLLGEVVSRTPPPQVLSAITENRFLSKKESAAIAAVSTSTIDNWGREGKISRHYFGGSVRFWLPELMDFLRSHKVESK